LSLFQPFTHHRDRTAFCLLRGIAVLFRDRRHIEPLGNRSAPAVAANRRDVGHEVVAGNQSHALDGNGEAVDAMFVEAHAGNLPGANDGPATPVCRWPVVT
jgi:hypothetical protein